MPRTPSAGASRSTAEDQRRRITRHAVAVFARSGFHATTVADVAVAAGVSPAYVFRLFPGKLGLFLAALEDCYTQIATVITEAGRAGTSDGTLTGAAATPTARLDAMAQAYAELIRDRDLIALQAHAQSACAIPEVRDAVRAGLALVVTRARDGSGASPQDVQRFLAYGQLCHLVVQAGLGDVDAAWSDLVTAGIRHPGP